MKAKKETTVPRRKSSLNIQFRVRGQDKRPCMQVTFKLTPEDGSGVKTGTEDPKWEMALGEGQR